MKTFGGPLQNLTTGIARGECLGGQRLSGEATNHLGGSGGMLPQENFGFLELGNTISCLLT